MKVIEHYLWFTLSMIITMLTANVTTARSVVPDKPYKECTQDFNPLPKPFECYYEITAGAIVLLQFRLIKAEMIGE